MKTYRDIIGTPYVGYQGRENIEWSNTWIDKASDDIDNRILLIGDSTSRLIRSTMSSVTGRPVDMIGSSFAIDDELFVNLIDSFFFNTLYKYKTIYIQIGTHSLYGKEGRIFEEKDYNDHYNNLNILIDYLKQHSDNIVLETCYLTVTKKINIQSSIMKDISEAGLMFLIRPFYKDYPHSLKNPIEEKKNEVIRKVASNRADIKFVDICKIMDKTNYVKYDAIHYEKAAKLIIVEELVKCLI